MKRKYIPLPFSKPPMNWLITGISKLYSNDLLSSSSSIVGISFLSPPDVPELEIDTIRKG